MDEFLQRLLVSVIGGVVFLLPAYFIQKKLAQVGLARGRVKLLVISTVILVILIPLVYRQPMTIGDFLFILVVAQVAVHFGDITGLIMRGRWYWLPKDDRK